MYISQQLLAFPSSRFFLGPHFPSCDELEGEGGQGIRKSHFTMHSAEQADKMLRSRRGNSWAKRTWRIKAGDDTMSMQMNGYGRNIANIYFRRKFSPLRSKCPAKKKKGGNNNNNGFLTSEQRSNGILRLRSSRFRMPDANISLRLSENEK